ncbi:MAG: TolC family protein [Bacteroidales bacterium]|jgi:outer membrane protein TolC|nr:TolC family protein [Bacteroidales bacterium]
MKTSVWITLLSFFLSTFSFFPCSLKAQEIYDLKRCLETGLEKNFAVRIVKNSQQISDNNASAGNAGYLPTIDLRGNYSGILSNLQRQYPADGSSMIEHQNVIDQTLDAGIYLNFTVFDGLNIQTNYRKLKEFREKGRLQTQWEIENFIAGLCTEYYNYIQQTIRLNNLKSTLSLSRERLRIVESQYAIGSMSRLSFQQAKVDFNEDSSKLVKQQEVLFASSVKLNQLMADSSLEQFIFTTDTSIALKAIFEKESLWKKTMENNIFLLLAEKEIDVTALELKNLQSANYPYLRINAGYGYTFNTYQTSVYKKQDNLGLTYGVTLGVNLFDGMNRRRKQVNAKIEIETKKLDYEKLQLDIKSDFTNIWMAYMNNLGLIELEEDNLKTAKETYDIAIDQYKLGSLSGIELREAQNSLLEAEERYIQAVYTTKLCEISLLQISGQIESYLN